MKKIVHYAAILSLLFVGLTPDRASAQVQPTDNANYIITSRPRTKVSPGTGLTTSNSMVDITYYDGLGRPEQQIAVAASPQGGDMVTPIVYDAAGRDNAIQYLPYASSWDNGQRRTSVVADQKSFYRSNFEYQDGDYAYVQNVFETSPLNRVASTYQPGKVFRTADKKTVYGYQANTSADQVRMLSVNTAGNLVVGGYYAANALSKNKAVNEAGLERYTFTDKLGRTVLERSTDGTTTHDTYYAYDDLGRLRFVMSPEGSAQMTQTTYTPTSSDLFKKYGYGYVYDSRGNVATKYLPGAERIEMRYDTRDRMTASQDGKGRTEGYWIVYHYDNHDRLTEQRRSTDATWSSNDALLIQNAYDAYPSAALAFSPVAGVAPSYDNRVKGLKTYEKVAVLGGTVSPVERTFYYDNKGRLIQTVEDNAQGGISRTTIQYDFMGNVLQSHESHSIQSHTATPSLVQTTNAYDRRNRLEMTTTRLYNTPTASPTTATVSYEYNALGKLLYKTFGNLPSISYSYNLQGWLSGQRSPNFTTTLKYHDRYMYSTESYTGNLTYWEWWNGGGIMDYHNYYDRWDRLTNASITTLHTQERFQYDRNGNHKWYDEDIYNGNQLVSKYGVSGTFVYDKNGNMTKNPQSGLDFTYNFLNLPEQVKAGSTVKAYYLYDATGRKLNTRNPAQTTSYDYMGSLVLAQVNGNWSGEVNFGEGLIRSNGEVTYFEKDHLGSVRVVLNPANPLNPVVERNDYMAYGGRLTQYGVTVPQLASNRYKYNGKETQPLIGDNLRDYGARMYDTNHKNWMTIDPLAELNPHISPYAFCSNNPMIRIDPTGMIDWKAVGSGAVNTVGGLFMITGGAIYSGSTAGVGAVLGGGALVIGGTGVTSFGIAKMVGGFTSDGSEQATQTLKSMPTSIPDVAGIVIDDAMGNENGEARNVVKVVEGAVGVATGDLKSAGGLYSIISGAGQIVEGTTDLVNSNNNSSSSSDNYSNSRPVDFRMEYERRDNYVEKY
jgi:RHS repeat-associated protein